MRIHSLRRIPAATLLAMTIGLLAGCRATAHTSVRIYEYDEQPDVRRTEDAQIDRYQMESPGEMVSPGTMIIDPG